MEDGKMDLDMEKIQEDIQEENSTDMGQELLVDEETMLQEEVKQLNPAYDEIVDYLEKLKIKSSLFGYSKEDTLIKMKELNALYENLYDQQIEVVEDWQKKVKVFMQREKERAQEEKEKALEELREEKKKEMDSLREMHVQELAKLEVQKTEELAKLEVQKKEEIAKLEAQKNEEIAKLEVQKNEEIVKIEAQKTEELEAEKCRYDEEIARMEGENRSRLEELREAQKELIAQREKIEQYGKQKKQRSLFDILRRK